MTFNVFLGLGGSENKLRLDMVSHLEDSFDKEYLQSIFMRMPPQDLLNLWWFLYSANPKFNTNNTCPKCGMPLLLPVHSGGECIIASIHNG